MVSDKKHRQTPSKLQLCDDAADEVTRLCKFPSGASCLLDLVAALKQLCTGIGNHCQSSHLVLSNSAPFRIENYFDDIWQR